MASKRIMIVDDSSFSIAYIRGILEENGYEVVGTAGTLEEVKEVTTREKPALVTMDMTLLGTDGLECTQAIREIDPTIKVIVVSSMMDDEIVNAANKLNVCGYIQKPVDADELITNVERVLAVEDLYDFLQEEYFSIFKESLLDGMNRMTKVLLEFKDEYCCDKEYQSRGISIIIGMIGKFSGRMLIDLSEETAKLIAEKMLRKEDVKRDEIIGALSEFANIISGNACSILNRRNKSLGLRVAPPSVLYGDHLLVSAPDFKTMAALSSSEYGEILINVGFQRGKE